jgi:restriction system protein
MKSEVPQYHQLLWPTLRALKAIGGSANIDELVDKIIEIEGIPESVQQVPHVGGSWTELEYRLAWARTYLKTVGAVENSSRGVWAITEKGERLTEADTAAIPAEVRRIRKTRRDKTDDHQDPEFQSGDNIEPVVGWKDNLLEVIGKMSPAAFERLAQRLLREAGFVKVEVTGKSGDGGIDGLGVLKVNLLSFQVLFQCKRYRNSVGASAIRDFRGAMIGRSDKGLMITTGTFTPEAKKEATRDGAPAVDLIDGDQLCELLKGLKLGVETRQVEQMIVDQEWFRRI